MADDKTLGQVYYEEIGALKADGVKNADAIRQVADKHGKTENAVRGSYYTYSKKLEGGGTSPRRRRTGGVSVDDLVGQARQALEQALSMVDKEVEQAKQALDDAQNHYDSVAAGVKDKKAELTKKLKALT